MLNKLIVTAFLLLHSFELTSSQEIPYSTNATAITLTTAQKNTLLNEHNNYRRQQSASNMQELQWSDWLAAAATNWTLRCYYEHAYDDLFPGYNQTYMTENLFVGTGTLNVSFADWVWYNEINAYNYTDNECYPSGRITECGHYTQMVWATTSLLGCGASVCGVLTDAAGTTYPSNMNYLACFFSLPGNVNGVKPYLLGSACSNCSSATPCCNAGLCTTCSTSTTAAAGGGGSATTTTAAAGGGGSATTTTAAAGGGGSATTTTAAAGGGGSATTTTAAAGGGGSATTTTAAAGGGGSATTTTAAAGGGGSVTTTTAAAGGGSGGSGGGSAGSASQATTARSTTTSGAAGLRHVGGVFWLACMASLIGIFLQ